MVNTGKPSTACFQCRARPRQGGHPRSLHCFRADLVIQCDNGLPGCEKCIKYGVVCPGYPDKNALVFRDDTTRIRARAIKKYDKNLHPEPASASQSTSVTRSRTAYQSNLRSSGVAWFTKSHKEGSSSTDSENPTMPNLVVWQPVNGGLVQGATAAFMEQFQTDDAEVFWTAFDCTSVLYPTASSSVCFSFALEAISLLAMSLLDKDSTADILRPAIQAYGRALRAINRALKAQDQRTLDHTFMAIELVCLFECLCEVESSWGRVELHLRGMMSMLAARGRKQFATKTGRRLFLSAVFLWVRAPIHMIPKSKTELNPDLRRTAALLLSHSRSLCHSIRASGQPSLRRAYMNQPTVCYPCSTKAYSSGDLLWTYLPSRSIDQISPSSKICSTPPKQWRENSCLGGTLCLLTTGHEPTSTRWVRRTSVGARRSSYRTSRSSATN